MPNTRVPAAAEGMSADTLEALLVAFVEEERESTRLSHAWSEAYGDMPDWAKAGPRAQMGDGTLSKDMSGMPRIEVLPEPSGGMIMNVIRPSIRDVWKHRTALLGPNHSHFYREDGTVEQQTLTEAGRAHRRRARLAAFAAVRKVIARIRRQREERQKAGLLAIDAAQDASGDRLHAIDTRIRALASSGSPTDLAAQALMEARFMVSSRPLGDQDDAVEWVRKTLLARLAPHLTGVLRLLVDDYASGDDTRTFSETLIGGGLPAGTDVIDLAGRAFVEGIAA